MSGPNLAETKQLLSGKIAAKSDVSGDLTVEKKK